MEGFRGVGYYYFRKVGKICFQDIVYLAPSGLIIYLGEKFQMLYEELCTGCFIKNNTKVFAYYIGQNAFCVLGHVAKFGYLAFKITKKTFFAKIEICGKNARFSNISENTRKIFLIFRTDIFLF